MEELSWETSESTTQIEPRTEPGSLSHVAVPYMRDSHLDYQ